MNKYKVGDRVYYRKRKFTIEHISQNFFREEFVYLGNNGVVVRGLISTSKLKPIITVRA